MKAPRRRSRGPTVACLALASAATAGCVSHGGLQDVMDAGSPRGVTAEMRAAAGGQTRSGELIELTPNALWVLWRGTLVRVPFGSVRSVRIGPHEGRWLGGRFRFSGAADRVHLWARHPAGLTEEQRLFLARALGRSALHWMDARGDLHLDMGGGPGPGR